MQITVTLVIIAVTVLFSWIAFSNRDLFLKFMHYPYEENRDKEYYRWITSVFLHGSWIHLGINMFVLWSFGTFIEGMFVELFGETMGRINFLALYLLSGVFADIPTYFKHKNNESFSSVGASGATSGIMFAFALLLPWHMIYLFGVIPIPAIIAAVLYLVYSSYSARQEAGSRIDHEAHFWGAVFGFVFTIALKPELFLNFLTEVTQNMPF
ncbi:MAG: rhomboid family intramembrane serine protease [Saprospiraceae bacterium]|nr:rhomboid family intramembrane serine protease [Saprospiraceae bacterium]MCF8252487.1 rhomboid family intramembrane serine protease [Saprospiraceae bacterium]MCF8282488.1 rhomboid family intramembrane serine protease [Bacteroidales bacterium]MCF8312646.1 rhomboid family intramembrane serine protease [Saprospiraceae bacterium]MCF8441088.1 rhomboid family intramembrane serine protease [Saprospiraceae bacterium]